MITRIFTFGYGQTCPITGIDLGDHYAVVTAPTAGQCRALMVAAFGTTWAFEYSSIEAATPPGATLRFHTRLAIGGHDPVQDAFAAGQGAVVDDLVAGLADTAIVEQAGRAAAAKLGKAVRP